MSGKHLIPLCENFTDGHDYSYPVFSITKCIPTVCGYEFAFHILCSFSYVHEGVLHALFWPHLEKNEFNKMIFSQTTLTR